MAYIERDAASRAIHIETSGEEVKMYEDAIYRKSALEHHR